MTRDLIVGLLWGFVGGYAICYLKSLRIMLQMLDDTVRGRK